MFFTSTSFKQSGFPSDFDFNANMDEIFNSILNRGTSSQSSYFEKTDSGTIITVSVPGHSKESLELTVEGNLIKLSSIPEKTPKGIKSLNRSWKDQENKFDLSKISATCLNGILTIELPLKEEKKPVTVEIK
jgi:HSP20 family molecular chaperone IbpA